MLEIFYHVEMIEEQAILYLSVVYKSSVIFIANDLLDFVIELFRLLGNVRIDAGLAVIVAVFKDTVVGLELVIGIIIALLPVTYVFLAKSIEVYRQSWALRFEFGFDRE